VLVVVGHAQDYPGALRGGQVGVTLFFVLSGFLITSLLVEELRVSGRLDLRRFYLRRALRLLPALLTLLVAVAFGMFLEGRSAQVAGDVLPPLLYFGNWVNASGGDLYLLSHTWSLSVEEQFYLVWPVSLLLLTRTKRPIAWAACIAVGLVIVRLALFAGGASADRLEAGSDTRGDALLIGCVAALLVSTGHQPARARGLLLIGGVSLGATLLVADPGMYVWGYSAAALAGAAIILGAVSGDGGLLTWGPLPFFGRISYGLYLWHFPIRGVLYATDLPLAVRAALMLALAFGMALLSYRYVELPFLRLKGRIQPAPNRPAPADA
jgi:peptidoglycan/LPS O-acetylase OafA/YrhL